MDPSACLGLILVHITDAEFEIARCAMSDLEGWVAKGGFLPTFPGYSKPLTGEAYQGVMQALEHIISASEGAGKDDDA